MDSVIQLYSRINALKITQNVSHLTFFLLPQSLYSIFLASHFAMQTTSEYYYILKIFALGITSGNLFDNWIHLCEMCRVFPFWNFVECKNVKWISLPSPFLSLFTGIQRRVLYAVHMRSLFSYENDIKLCRSPLDNSQSVQFVYFSDEIPKLHRKMSSNSQNDILSSFWN